MSFGTGLFDSYDGEYCSKEITKFESEYTNFLNLAKEHIYFTFILP